MKKVLSIILALMMACTSLAVVASAHGEEDNQQEQQEAVQMFVKEINIKPCRDSRVEKVKNNYVEYYESKDVAGYVIRDINVNYGNDDDYIVFSYSYTTDPAEAITGLLVNSYSSRIKTKENLTVDGVEYTKVYGDLNDNQGGDYVHVYTTTSHQTGHLITDIGFRTSDSLFDGDESWEDTPAYESDSPLNLNKGSRKTNKSIYMTFNSILDTVSSEIKSTYIAKIFMASGDSPAARDQLEETLIENDMGCGYEVLNYDLNEGAKGKYIYLGYVFTKDATEAVNGVMLASVKSSDQNERFIYNEDNTIKYERLGGNLNEGTSGDTINLYVTYDGATGKALNRLGMQVGRTNSSKVQYSFVNDERWHQVSKYGDEKDTIDLNDGADGKFMYLWDFYSDYTAEEDTKLIKDIYVKVGADIEEVYRAMDQELLRTGLEYDYSPFDLNKGTDGSVIIIGWTYTDNVKEAITDVMLNHSSRDDAIEDELEVDKVKFTKIPVNLKEGNKKGFAYLYTARDKNAEYVLTNLGIEAYDSKLFTKNIKYFAESDKWSPVSTYTNELKYDLNEGNRGYYIFLWKEMESVLNIKDNTSSDDDTDSNSDDDTDNSSDSDDKNTDSDKIVYGDVTGDSKVTMEDVTSIQRVVAKLSTFRPSQKERADVTDDGKVNMEDITYIQRYVAKLVKKFPADKVSK